MVSILPSARTPWDVIGSQIGQNLHETLPGAVQQGYNRGQLQNSLSEIQKIAGNQDSSPLDITLAAMKAGAGIPGSERYLGALIPELVKFAEARRAQNVQLPGENQGQRQREPMEQNIQGQVQQLPQFLNKPQQENKFFPSNIGAQESPGNLPQPATTGQVVPLLTPSEKRKEAKRLSQESTKQGIPLTPVQALEEVNKSEEDKRLHNQSVENERKQRVASQENYGEKAIKALEKVHSGATDEQKAIFGKKGEEAASRGDSEAEIDRYLAKEAVKFKNAMVNTEKDMSAPRLHNMIGRAANGTYKDLKQAGDDLRSHLKPLLDLGLYDTARNLLSNQGYGPEERDAIINPLNERANIALNRIPSVKKIFKPGLGGSYSNEPVNLNNIKEGLLELKKADPNFSLPLARKAFEDKNYDWRSFKDALNELESEGFKLEDDQQSQRGILDTPPLSSLEQILHNLNLIGR